MVTVPAFLPVTLPPETVAMLVLLLVQVIVLFVAFDGFTVAVKVVDPFILIVADVLLRLTEVTGTVGCEELTTVTLALAFLPLCAVAVIVAVPALLPITLPPETVAILVLLLDQVIDLFVAFDGDTLAFSV